MKTVPRIISVILMLGLFSIVFGWAILAMPLFSDLRRPALEKLLSQQIGQPLYIKGDARIVLGLTSQIHASQVEIPSETIPDVILAELNALDLDLDLRALQRGKVNLDNVNVDGLKVRMLTSTNGTKSWTTEDQADFSLSALEQSINDTQTDLDGDGILDFLSDKTASFTSIGLLVDNKKTGFQFDFDLTKLNLEQLGENGGLTATGQGTVNGQTFDIKGHYPRGKAFTTAANFGAVKLEFDGAPNAQQQGGGFDGTLTLNTGEIGDLLEVLGLERDFEGLATLAADLRYQSKQLKVSDMKTDINLSHGQEVTATGSVEDLFSATGVDAMIKARLYPKGKPPEQVSDLNDLRLTNLSSHVVSTDDALEFKDLILTTNAFDEYLNRIGPVNIGRVFRGDEGNLMLENIALQAGPVDAPFLTAKGSIKDLLQLKQVSFAGKMSLPATILLKELGQGAKGSLGKIEGDFSFDDSRGFLSLNSFNAHSADTKIWDLTTHVKLGNVNDFEDLSFDLNFEVKDNAALLAALDLKAANIGRFVLKASAQGKKEDFTSTLEIIAGKSQVDAKLKTSLAGDRPMTDGQISSKSVVVEDVKNVIEVVSQFGKTGQTSKSKSKGAKAAEKKATVTDLLEPEDFLLDQDSKITIDIKKIVGQAGITSLSSQLTATNGQAELGPVEVDYDGGHFSGTAKMDMVKSPQLLSLSGTTRGWKLGHILHAIGVKYGAEGQLHGNFAFTGHRRSVNDYLNTMQGSASILMENGGIATSLIELSGLGIFPWLFSEELRKGYSKITCLAAPIKVDAGEVSFDSFVAETAKVQLVARGDLDWIKNTISIHAEARKLDRPLSRSAWPFEVKGSLTDPKVKLLLLGHFQKRKDGAHELPDRRKACVPDIDQLK